MDVHAARCASERSRTGVASQQCISPPHLFLLRLQAGDDFFTALSQLVSMAIGRGAAYEHIIFEASGVAEPKLIRAMFQVTTCFQQEQRTQLWA